MKRRDWIRCGMASAAGLALPAWAQGAASTQDWPSRPIRLMVPFPAGSSPDIIGRLVGEALAQSLGQPVVIENRAGAGGNVGTGVAAKSPPDGYHFLFTIQGPLVTAPSLKKNLGYDPSRDLAPVSLIATSPNVLLVDPALGANSVADFVRIARQRAGQLNYGSVGVGSASHLAMELFKTRAGVDLLHVPYQGFPQIVTAMLAGEIHAAFMVPGIAMGPVQAGKLKALGVTTLQRTPALPDMPTLAEQGHADFEAISWQAVLAPAGTPRAIVERMSREITRIVQTEAARERMLALYFSPAAGSPEELAALMRSERERWAKVIEAAGVQPE